MLFAKGRSEVKKLTYKMKHLCKGYTTFQVAVHTHLPRVRTVLLQFFLRSFLHKLQTL